MIEKKAMRRPPLRLLVAVLLGATLIAGCATARVDSPEPTRVMSFNIRLNHAGDGEDAWPHRKDIAASMIRFHRADAAGLQEALKEQIDDLAVRLPDYAWFGVGRNDGGEKGEFTPIFYRKDRFDVLRHDTFWLSETPAVPGSKSWDAAITRIATWGLFRDRKTGRRIVILNTHFDHVGGEAREQSARLIMSRLDSLAGGLPIVVMGDFNTTEDAAPYAVMTSSLRDAFYASEHGSHGPTSTWTGFNAIEPDRRIDYIFVDGLHVIQHGILSDTFDGRFPSDHLPVLAELAFP